MVHCTKRDALIELKVNFFFSLGIGNLDLRLGKEGKGKGRGGENWGGVMKGGGEGGLFEMCRTQRDCCALN